MRNIKSPTLVRRTGIAVGALFLMAVHANQPATAAPIFSTSLADGVSLFVFKTGTDSVSGCKPVAGSGEICGIVDIVGTEIMSTSTARRGEGTIPSIDTRGGYLYNDLFFTNILSPGDTGMISVSANFFLDWNTNDAVSFADFVQVSADINGTEALNQIFGGQLATSIATASVLVPLGEAILFQADYRMRLKDSVAGTESGDAVYRLIDFTLPGGYTVNSDEAGIVNNQVIPEPSTFSLFGIALGILGFLDRRRRRKVQAV